MKEFRLPIQVRWADLDPNMHVRHSVYYDWGALCRINFLNQQKVTTALMQQLQIGPILFREECVFRREIRLDDEITINLELLKAKKDFSRWTFRHTIIKGGDTVAAILTLDGAWLDVVKRKLATPPKEVMDGFTDMPLGEEFQWMD